MRAFGNLISRPQWQCYS